MQNERHIWKEDAENGMVYLRNGITVAFFLPVPIDKIAATILEGFDEYLKMIPPDTLRWASVGANSEEWKPVVKKTFEKCRGQLNPEAARKRSLTSFELADGNNGGEAPGHGVLIIGNPYDPDLPDERCLVQFYFPPKSIEDENVETFIATVRKLANILPYTYGYASPALQWSRLFSTEALTQARAIAARHPGYDIEDNAVGRSYIDAKVRGARWLTFLGAEIAEKLGGSMSLRRRLPQTITVEQVGPGVFMRAGVQPEIGDRNRKIGTPLLCEVAKVLEPVTTFGEMALYRTDFADQDEEVLARWERRFLD